MDNLDRIPPQSIEAEVCVLGSMMLDATALTKVRAIVTASDFYRPAHQTIFRELSAMADARKPVDLVSVKEAFARRGVLGTIGKEPGDVAGMQLLVDLVESVPNAANAEYYATMVCDKAKLRQLILAGQDIINEAYSSREEANTVLSNVGSQLATFCRPANIRSTNASADVDDVVTRTINGQRRSAQWPWPAVTCWARPCAPGCVTMLCGDPGATKSFMLQEAMMKMYCDGVPVAMMHMEKDRRYHLSRALAQLEGNSRLTNDTWIEANPDVSWQAVERHKDMLDGFGSCLWDDSDGKANMTSIGQWIAARASDGARVIGVDPITAIEAGRFSWEEDKKLVKTCESVAARHECSIVLVSHPRAIGAKAPAGQDNIAGGRAYSRFTDCVLWLSVHHPPAKSRISTPCGPAPEEVEFNRTLQLYKTRDGAGRGLGIAMQFSSDTLRMSELGVIIPKPKMKGT